MTDTCHICGGTLEERRIDHLAVWRRSRVLVCNVPARVCNSCGESLFAPDVARRIQEIAQAGAYPGEPVIMVPVRDFASFDREEAAASG